MDSSGLGSAARADGRMASAGPASGCSTGLGGSWALGCVPGSLPPTSKCTANPIAPTAARSGNAKGRRLVVTRGPSILRFARVCVGEGFHGGEVALVRVVAPGERTRVAIAVPAVEHGPV